jgi:predicted nuclease of predicted toxin-antitoxin system
MRFLLDENTHIKLLNWFTQAGHDAIRVPDGLKNGKVIALAQKELRVLITHDKDFGDPLVYPPKNHPGIILLRIHPPSLPKTLVGLEALLKNLPSAEFDHQLIILEEHGYHLLS